jgi:hypothetical protein
MKRPDHVQFRGDDISRREKLYALAEVEDWPGHDNPPARGEERRGAFEEAAVEHRQPVNAPMELALGPNRDRGTEFRLSNNGIDRIR